MFILFNQYCVTNEKLGINGRSKIFMATYFISTRYLDFLCLVLKAKKHSNKNIIDGSQVSTGQSSAISQGAKFEYRSIHGREFISSRGPLLGSIMIGLSGSGEGEVKVKYVIRAKEDTLSSRHR